MASSASRKSCSSSATTQVSGLVMANLGRTSQGHRDCGCYTGREVGSDIERGFCAVSQMKSLADVLETNTAAGRLGAQAVAVIRHGDRDATGFIYRQHPDRTAARLR